MSNRPNKSSRTSRSKRGSAAATPLDLVRVDWIDAEGAGVWKHKEDFRSWAEDEPMAIVSFGLLAKETRTHLVLIQSVNATEVDNHLKIPRSCVKSVRKIETTDIVL